MNVQVVLGKSIPQMTEKKELLELLVAHKKTGWMMMQMMPSKLTEPKKRGDIIYRNKQEKQPNQLSSLDPVRYRLRLVFKLSCWSFLHVPLQMQHIPSAKSTSIFYISR